MPIAVTQVPANVDQPQANLFPSELPELPDNQTPEMEGWWHDVRKANRPVSQGTSVVNLTKQVNPASEATAASISLEDLGTMATQNAVAVQILGGTLTGVTFTGTIQLSTIDNSTFNAGVFNGFIGSHQSSSTTETVDVSNLTRVNITSSGNTLSVSGMVDHQEVTFANHSSGDADLNFDVELQGTVYSAPVTMKAGEVFHLTYDSGNTRWHF